MNTKLYWYVLGEKAVRAGAAGALAVLGTGHVAGYSVPWQGLLYGFGIGALVSILTSLSSSAVPDTLPTSFLPRALLKGSGVTVTKTPPAHPGKHETPQKAAPKKAP